MPKFFILSKQIIIFLFIIALALSIELSQAIPMNKIRAADMAISNYDEVYHQRRIYDLNQLRHFLLTSNEEQRAARRDKQNFYKQQLIREYLRSINDPNSDRLQEVKKRTTYCSIQDILHGSLCRRRTIDH
ncbi:unnamed protein product [Rotaria sp. Silwood2]|nr:unnamed protein product [Rotaria sp. Silwood2]